jgi:glycogen debranching enzyme
VSKKFFSVPTPPESPPLPQIVHFGRELCGQLDQAERREWWLTNGRGAYAAGTVAGTLTRRYHGLLLAPVTPPLGRMLLFTKADATVLDGSLEWPLFTNRWASGAVSPPGYRHLESFHLEGRMPVWRFAIGRHRIEQRIWLDAGADRVNVAWRLVGKIPPDPPFSKGGDEGAPFSSIPPSPPLLKGGDESPPLKKGGWGDLSTKGGRGDLSTKPPFEKGGLGGFLQLRVALLVNARDHHHVTTVGTLRPEIRLDNNRVRVVHHDGVTLEILAHGGTLALDLMWNEGFDLPLERERGLEDLDNHLQIGTALLTLTPGVDVGISAAVLQPIDNGGLSGFLPLAHSRQRHHSHDQHVLAQAFAANPPLATAPAWIHQLILAADSFLFTRPLPTAPAGESVIAGYPWFGDWGRDTMIALPGLTLATGRPASARRILLTFAQFIDGGMVPNCFPGAGATPAYNSVDAALWYLEAWRAYVGSSGDLATLREVFPTLQTIIAAYRDGTRHGIGMDPADGLIRAGAAGEQLTWMDAKAGDWVVTPRCGKPVEINALWYNALIVMRDFADQLGAQSTEYAERAAQVALGFQRYVRPDGRGLFDVLDGAAGAAELVRPNQIFAVSLPASPLTAAAQAQVVAIVGETLLTSHGLRSLAPSAADYRGSYRGNVRERDGAYHQGTVWGWLLGHYALAEYRVTDDAVLAQSRLEPLAAHLSDAGLGSISEIFDGDPPHVPRGAPLQAWSVACTLEAWWRLG